MTSRGKRKPRYGFDEIVMPRRLPRTGTRRQADNAYTRAMSIRSRSSRPCPRRQSARYCMLPCCFNNSRSPTTRLTIRLTRALPPSLPRPLTFVSRSRTSLVCIRLSLISGSSVLIVVAGSGAACGRSAEVPACDGHRDPGDVRRLVRGQEQDRRGLFLRRTVTVHETRRDRLIDDLTHPCLFIGGARRRVARNAARRGFGAAGRHAADADTVFRKFKGETGGDGVHAAFGSGVGHTVHPARRH